MSQFEFFMVFYGLLIGLGVAELLLGFMNLLRHRTRPKLGLYTPLLGLLVFLQLMALFIDAWLNLRDVQISMTGLAVPTLIGVFVFAAAVLVVPRDTEEWQNLDDYFLLNRRWTIGLLIAANLLIMVHEIVRLPAANLPTYTIVNLFGFTLLGIAMLARNRITIALSLGAMILLYLSLYSGKNLTLFRLVNWLLA
ncbi:hypothetical protein P1X14_19290 [Sphingomonas sp. AOB5]|uniref:hypothetical protein n=1 Tax=Sphingomonas sp. AOB5 TaxID=3034017 RepID=UPI0023F8E800|nr:hypothetical protein [Sphingomonas sp. AOB5]MDF7777410.1 hypothetical protein [Sphingomonas sp. AOB5]